MRLFSAKIRAKKNKLARFKAPTSVQLAFIGSKISILQWKTIFTALIFVTVVTYVGSEIYAYKVATKRLPFGEKETLLMYPTEVNSNGWSNLGSVLVPDLRNDSLYQDFSINNSASLGGEMQSDVDDDKEKKNKEDKIKDNNNPNQAETSSNEEPPVNSDDSTIQTENSDEEDFVESGPEEQPVESEEPAPEVSDPVTTSSLDRVGEWLAVFTGQFNFSVSESEISNEEPSEITADESDVNQEETNSDVEAEEESEEGLPADEETDLGADDLAEPIETLPDVEVIDDGIVGTTTDTTPTPEDNDSVTASSSQPMSTSTESVVDYPTNDLPTIALSDFSLPELKRGQFISSVQLRLSLAGKLTEMASGTLEYVDIVYRTPNYSASVGQVVIDEEISNAINGGYFLYALPVVDGDIDLDNLTIELVFHGEEENIKELYVDALWLEIETSSLTKEDLKKRLNPDQLGHLKAPDFNELISDDLDFTREELPNFNLKYVPQRNIAVRAVRQFFMEPVVEIPQVVVSHKSIGPVGAEPNINLTDDGLISITFDETDLKKMKPGQYTIELTMQEGDVKYVDTFDFQWGILSINPNKTEYNLNETAKLAMGALTPNGNTLCNANLNLYLIAPDGYVDVVPVNQSGLCTGNNVIDVPDYDSEYLVNQIGTYEMYLERQDESGNVIGHTTDTFLVVNNQTLAIRREGPSRIYPPAVYPMEITVEAPGGFNGTLTEKVPLDFKVFDTDASVRKTDEYLELTWDISLMPGTEETYSYNFDAPDLSPYLYELGPATLESAGNNFEVEAVSVENSSTTGSSTVDVVESIPATTSLNNFTEHRAWQIASDATGNMILYWDGASAIPTNWSCLSCGSGTFYQRFTMGSTTYNSTGGATTHTHTGTGSVNASSLSSTEPGSGAVAPVAHSHTYTPTISTVSNLPSYRQLRVIQYTASAGEPATIPTGAIAIFDATVPTGWTRYSAQDGYYVRGENTPGTTGGANTHTHTITGNTGASSGAGTRVRGGGASTGATDTHTHAISTSTASQSIEPPYITVIMGKLNATSTVSVGMISMWTDDIPTGWSDMSSAGGEPFTNRFLKASTTYGSTGGGSTHAPANVTGITSGAPSALTATNLPGGSAGASSVHTHSVSVNSFSTTSNLPPYLTVVFGKKLNSDPIYNQLNYRWYANANSQTLTDEWPTGATDILRNEPITATNTPVSYGDVVRLRLNARVTNATSTVGSLFKLQYGSGNVCSAISSWTDVATAASTTAIWRGYNNAGVTDHSTLSSTTIASTTVAETYEENGFSTTTPNQIGVGGVGEWDFVLQQNGAVGGANYCFRLVESDGTPFTTYTNYPKLLTNYAPIAPTQSVPFDNAKVATTTPSLRFVTTDPESEEVHYEVEIDNDYDFSSPVIDRNSDAHEDDFENLVLNSDKAPFSDGELIEFNNATALTNNTTYWWRVRALDPDGSNTWGAWATPMSFTATTSMTVSTWYQTTEEQFDTDTLVGVETNGTDDIDLITGSTTGTTTGTSIDFDDGELGTAWGELQFRDTETSGDIKYHIYYLNDSQVWTRIPDADLPGNATGFDSSPVSLLGLETDTYNEIRVVANFTNSGGSPSLQSWAIEWGYRVETPTITRLFPNEKVGTTTPTFEFTTTDPQSDDLTYQIQWSTSNLFTSSTTRTSGVSSGFTNIDNGGNFDPFDSGDVVQFKVQPGDALTNNTTYWWRVRAKDTTGDDQYSFWTDERSFTVDNTVTVSTWYQTTEEQFDTNILSGTVSLANDSVSVATTATEAMLVYGEGTETEPRYREWNGTSWSTEDELQDVGAAIRWTVVKAAPTREEYIAVTVGTDADVNAQIFSTGAWGDLQEMTTNMGSVNARGFDVAYETTSGDAIVAYCDGDADPSYYVWNGSSWTSGGTINLASTNNCEWIQLASDPNGDEIIIMSRDTVGTGAASYETQVWTGSAWGNSSTQGGARGAAYETMALEYEDGGGQALSISGDGNPARFEYNSWSGAAWAGLATQGTPDNLMWAELVQDDGSDNMVLCYIDESVDVGIVRWTGSAWAGQTTLDATGNDVGDRPISCSYESTTGRDGYIMAVYSDDTNVRYQTYNGTSWSGEASVSTITDSASVNTIRTGTGAILAMLFDDVNDRLDFSTWNGSSWSTAQTLESDSSVGSSPFGEPFMMAPRNPGTEGTTIVAPGIDFNDGTGPYWDEFSWNDTTPGTSNILYSVQYYDGDSWEFIPDVDLPGNSAGTTTSPIDLSGLSISTYDLIRPYAELTCQNAATCPAINDWTVTWASGIAINGTADEYDQTTNVTSGTVAVAVNGTLQVGKTGTIAGGLWSIPNVTAFSGDTISIFVTGATDNDEAAIVTTYDGSGDMTGLQLFERHLVIGSPGATSTLTNADIGVYDFTNTEDIFFDFSGSLLRACATTGCGDAEVYVHASSSYTPGGTLVTHDLEINGTLVATGTVLVSGSWDNNHIATLTNSTLVMTATSTSETINETGAVSPAFNNLTFGTTTGSATWSLATPLDVNGNLTVTRGTLARGTSAINIAGNLVNAANGFWTGVGTTTFDGSGANTWSDANATLQNVGRVLIDGTTKSITLAGNVLARSVNIGADDTLDASTSHYDISVLGNWINQNAFVSRQGTVNFIATTSGRIITTTGDNFYDLNFNGSGGAWSFTESTLNVTNDLTIGNGTVTLPTATTTIAGSFSVTGGAFAHNNASVQFTSSAAETITALGSGFTNVFYNLRFNGSGSFTFTEANATSTNNVIFNNGGVTLPSNQFAVGGNFRDTGGSFNPNNATVRLYSSGAQTLQAGGSSFYNLTTAGSGPWSFSDTNVTISNDLNILNGTLTLPSGTLSLGGSIDNNATITPGTGTVLFNSSDAGETVDLGNSSLYNATFNNVTGGWTVSDSATTTNNLTLTAGTFVMASSEVLSVGATFTNSVGGASTTWTGSTLSFENGTYSLNSKTNTGDSYNILRVDSTADISMWNSSATTYNIISGGSLYSQDHNNVDGDLYIFGQYGRTSGTEYWSYANDFDGTALGGGSRQVDVRFQSGATAALTNSTLSIVGGAAASTTIANQGSGTYTVSVSSGTTSAQYYNFSDLGATGLSLINSNKVTNLGNGSYEVDANGGSAITLSSTTIDANPAEQIFNVTFSTTTAINADNVTQTGGTPASYWWFRSSTGNLDGEQFDNDTGNPGSVRWDDSALVLTISGTVYSDDGTTPLVGGTCNGVATPIRVVVQHGSTYDAVCSNVDGSFSVPGVVVVGDAVVTTYLNGASGGQRAVTVTKTPTADISDLDLYVNRVITRHEDVDPLTIVDMAVFDFDNDPDIPYTAASTTNPDLLTVAPSFELHIASSTTFAPGGTVTLQSSGSGASYDGTLHLDPDATFTGVGTTTYSIGGSLIVESGAVFTAASSTINMTATTSGKTITTAANETLTLNQLNFTGSGGGWNLNGDLIITANINVVTGTVTGTEDVTINNGSFYGNGLVSLGTGTTTIARTNTLGGTQGWTFGNLRLGNGTNIGTTTPGSNATTTILGRLTIRTAHFLDAGASSWNLAGTGTVFVESGTFLEDTSTVTYSGAGATNLLSTNYYNLNLNASAASPTYTAVGLGIQTLNNLSVGISGTTTVNFTTNDTALNVDGDLTINTRGNFVASNSGSFTIAGDYENNGTMTASAGSITFDGSASTNIAAGNSAFGTVVINGTGTFIISEPATTSAGFNLNNAGSFTLNSGQTLAVGGIFTNAEGGAATTWTGSTLRLYSGTNYQMNAKTIDDSYNILSIGANTDIRMWNSSAATYTVNSSGSLYSQDHNASDGDLYVYGNYPGNGGTDYWSYATDFDGSALGGGSRQVDVRFASGASMTMSSGGLQVLGTAAATTTIDNQGSGTYGLRLGGSASTTWSYYAIEDTDSSGLTFSGSPTVTTLSHGYVRVTTSGGSAMTVGGTAINANPAKTYTNNVFATTTAIAAYNVTATGTSVSSWRFTNHSGNIDGEAKDVDPDGDPGYIVWDDSAANITISGNVYSDEGVTVSSVCDGSTNNVRIMVAGVTNYTTSCNAGTGFYSIPGISYSANDAVIVYIDGESEKAANVTADLVSNIANMHLYENRVIVRHENTNPLSIDDMATWDSSDDADIPFTAVSGSPDTLSLPANRKLIIWNSKTFTPGGNVTISGGGGGSAYDGTFELYGGATFNAANGESHSIGGSLISGVSAIFNAAQSTTTFTTSGAARTVDINNDNFYNARFTGVGSWTVSDTTFEATNDLSITNGALTLPAATSTIGGSFNLTGGSFVASGGLLYFTATDSGNIVRFGGSTANDLRFNGAGGSWTMSDTNATTTGYLIKNVGSLTLPSGVLTVGDDFINAGTLTHNNGTLRLTATTSSTTITLATNNLNNLIFAGGSSFNMSDGSATLIGDLIVASGTVAISTSTLTIGGSLDANNGAMNTASGTILFNSSDAGETIDPGDSDLYNVVFANAAGGWTISANATTTNNFTLTTALNFTQASSTRLYVGGVFTNSVGGTATTWSGSNLVLNAGLEYAINTKIAGGDSYNILTVGANTDISSWNSRATSTSVALTGSWFSQDHGTTDGRLNIYGDYHIATTTNYWSYATDFDGTALVGPARRAVTVYQAANSTTTVDGGTLNMLGVAGATTTITNQGSGNYSFNVSEGTFNAAYYAFRNLNADGLNLSGEPIITSLNNGDYELAVSGGNLISLSSTTLNANASLVISGNRFATTTAITGFNINLSGSTANAWTYVGHIGNLDGEAYDNDGGSACGSLRWDNSSCLLTQQTHYRWRLDDGNIGVPASEWFDTDWDGRQRVRLTNSDNITYTDAAVKIEVAYDSDMQADFEDLRFTTSDGVTPLYHWIERYTANTDADVWVKIPSLAASDVTDIFMYYNNNSATSSSSGEDVFIAVDDFEDGSLSEYSGAGSGGDDDKLLFTVDGSFAYGGVNGLDNTGQTGSRADDGGMARFDQTVSQGETIRYMQYVDLTGGDDEVCTMFGVQSPVTNQQNYGVCLEQISGTDFMAIVENVVDSATPVKIRATSTVAYAAGWYEIEIDWGTDDSIFVSLYKDSALVATTSVTDNSYTSGGFGFTYWFNAGGWDNFTSRPTLQTEPTVGFGNEQSDGGASWAGALDTAVSSFSPGDTARLRLAIENSGLSVNDQYRLEYVEQGAAPSCEAVNPTMYATVPDDASCGGSPVCMTTSASVADGDSTTDLLLETEGEFVPGRFVEDPSETSAALTIDQDEYTELEYAIRTTNNIADQNLCFRVTDAGTDLDTYLRIAKLSIRFDPSFGAVSLNSGQPITLTPGATTTIYATSTVTDLNGFADLTWGSSTIYRSGAGAACAEDNNNCYISTTTSQCSFIDCAGNSCTLSCSADIYYHADPTDDGTFEGQEWLAYMEVSDVAGGNDFGSANGVELLSLRALDVENSINYGSLEVDDDTGAYNASTTIENLGNASIDVEISGTNLSDGASSVIPANQQIFATSTFTYNSCVYCQTLSTSTVNYEVDITKPTAPTPYVTDVIYWGIEIPFGAASNPHSGNNTFSAISDD